MSSRRREGGAALIVAIFITTVAAAMMMALGMDSIVAMRRAENQALADQAWLYLMGAEELAAEMIRLRLEELAEERDEAGTLQLPDLTVPPFTIDDGWLSFTVEDLQGRFNLNTLRSDFSGAVVGASDADKAGAQQDGEGLLAVDKAAVPAPEAVPGEVVRTVSQQRFVRLLRTIGETPMTEAEAAEVLEAIQDWLDADTLETGFGGAEQAHYAQQETPYRPADGPLRDISEMRLIKGISAQLYRDLRPWVTVWPEEGAALNLAAVGPSVMAALYHNPDRMDEPLDLPSAQGLVTAVQEGEITTMEDLLARAEWGPDPVPGDALGTSSEVFLVLTQVQVGRLLQGLHSVIEVKDNKTRILARSLTTL